MTKKLSKQDVKDQDVFQKTAHRSWQWFEQNIKPILATLLIIFLVGFGIAMFDWWQNRQENLAQEAYAKIEVEYRKIKEDFTTAEEAEKKTPSEKASEKKTQNNEKPKTTEDNKEIKDASQPPPLKPSGDLTKDYGVVVNKLKTFIESYPNFKATNLATLTLIEIYTEYRASQQALEFIQPHLAKMLNNDLLSGLVRMKIGDLFADTNNCASAMAEWDQLVNSKELEYLHGVTYLKMGVCSETLGQPENAKINYQKAIGNDPNSMTAALAKKYLRLLDIELPKKG